MNHEPMLLAAPSGDVLNLRPEGPWTAANVVTLETLSRSVGADVDRSRVVTLDMSGVSALDTLGAWVLEKLSRRATSSGRSAEFVGVADHFSGLMDEVRQVNRHTPAPTAAPNPVLARLGDLGKSTVGAREDITIFLQMLGALFMAIIGVLRRPRSLRLTSLVYQLYRIGWQAIPIVALITFLIGAIIAQQGFFHFRRFGAESYTVDMVGILVLRELGVLIVAIMGLLVNILIFRILTHGDNEHVNIKGAALHVMGDLLGSVGAIAAAVTIYFTGWEPIDPILSVVVSLLVLRSAWDLLRASLHILLEGAPDNAAPDDIERHLKANVDGVALVRHVHVWSLTSGRTLATLHVELADEANAAAVTREVVRQLKTRFDIEHATVAINWDNDGDGSCSLSRSPADAAHGDHDHELHACMSEEKARFA